MQVKNIVRASALSGLPGKKNNSKDEKDSLMKLERGIFAKEKVKKDQKKTKIIFSGLSS